MSVLVSNLQEEIAIDEELTELITDVAEAIL
jgi:ferritin-like metal-binding protein YciE